jgi:restriction system protein
MRRGADRAARQFIALPWWVILVASPVAYVAIAHGLPLVLKGPLGTAFAGAARILGVFTAAGIAVFAALAALHQRRAQRLFDQQTGLESIRRLTWRDFERVVAEAYRRRGYSVTENGGGGADGGVDLVLSKEGNFLVQCKQWQALRVGVKEVRELLGILTAEKATGAILITSGLFTEEARAFAAGKPLELIDGTALLTLVDATQGGASPRASQTPLPRPTRPGTLACPRCGEAMVLRTAQQGPRAGSRFWGCSKYPRCRGTVEA